MPRPPSAPSVSWSCLSAPSRPWLHRTGRPRPPSISTPSGRRPTPRPSGSWNTIPDLVIADLTIPNANVYYEIGIRHAARPQGCVLVSADWTKPLFDVDQMRRITFPMPEGAITDETAAAIKAALVAGIPALAEGRTPPFASISGFPGPFDLQRTQTFQTLAKRLSEFQAEVTAVRRTVDRNA